MGKRKQRIRILKKYNVNGRHKIGEILYCHDCGEKMVVGTDDIVSKLIPSAHAHTIYYSVKCAKELNII